MCIRDSGTIALYHPEHSILLNIEEEHMDFYESLAAIEAVYGQLLDQTSGTVFYCVDDPHAARVCKGRPRRAVGAVCAGSTLPLPEINRPTCAPSQEMGRSGVDRAGIGGPEVARCAAGKAASSSSGAVAQRGKTEHSPGMSGLGGRQGGLPVFLQRPGS